LETGFQKDMRKSTNLERIAIQPPNRDAALGFGLSPSFSIAQRAVGQQQITTQT